MEFLGKKKNHTYNFPWTYTLWWGPWENNH